MFEKVSSLISQYESQIAIYREMLTVAREQQQLCTEADFTGEENLEKFNRLLLKRQKLMDLIEENQSEVLELKKSLRLSLGLEEISGDALAGQVSFNEIRKLLEAEREIIFLLQKISALDSRTQELFQSGLDRLKQGIEKIQRNKKANRAYNPAGRQREGFFLDRSE
ncbi:MAG: flagellar export chaperone FlgN [Dethiobacteria bacterium]